MLILIEPNSDTPLYVQLRNQVIKALVSGELKEGDTLPSVRQMAQDLGVNLHTVNKAYKVLEDEGYLRIFGRRGAVIGALPAYTSENLAQLQEQIKHLFTEAQSHGIDETLFRELIDQTLKEKDN